MGKDKRDISWKKYKNAIKEIDPLVLSLKKKNDELDELLVKLYAVFQTKNSLSFYKTYAAHIDINQKWYASMHKYNNSIKNARIISV